MSTQPDPQNADELNQGELTTEDTQAAGNDAQADDLVGDEQGSEASKEDSSDELREEQSLSRRQRAELRRQGELKALMDKVAFLEKLAVGNGNPNTKVQDEAKDDTPKLEDYDGRPLNEYLADYNKHLESKLIGKAQEEAKIAIQRERQMAQLDNRIKEARKDLSDWEEVMKQAEEDGVQVQNDTAAFIAESDSGPRVAYYLAKNPEVHERINALSPMRRLAELGKLEDKLMAKQEQAPVTKKVTSAPAKLSQTQGKAAIANLDPANAARQGYAAWKAADEARKAAATKKR